MDDFLYPSNSKTYEKETWYNKTSLEQTYFASPSALRYIQVLKCLQFDSMIGR